MERAVLFRVIPVQPVVDVPTVQAVFSEKCMILTSRHMESVKTALSC